MIAWNRSFLAAMNMANARASLRNQVIYEFGLLMQPLVALAKAEHPPQPNEYRVAIAKVHAGDSEWRGTVKQFTTLAPDVLMAQEYNDISHVPERCRAGVSGILRDGKSAKDLSELQRKIAHFVQASEWEFFRSVDSVPLEWQPEVFAANTPFTSYLRIKEVVATARRRLHYFDRYLKPAFFELFLPDVHRHVSVRLVTTPGNRDSGVTGVITVANLAKQEYSDFGLLEVTQAELHDRNLRVDDQIFSLGPGVDRAGVALTNFGPSDSSASAHSTFDQIIAKARVVL